MSSHLELIKFIRQLYNTKNNIVLHEPFFDEQEKKILLEVIDSNFVSLIGNTPLIKLKGPSEKTGCNIYGKAELLNPGGSVKDRAALA